MSDGKSSGGCVTLTVCETCRHPDGTRENIDGVTGGEMLARHVSACLEESGNQAVELRRHACLMGCDRHCNVGLQAPGKLTYVLGRFEPARETAEALVEFASLYATSETGQVPFRQWPQGVKGHFITRVPPLPDGN